MNPLDQLRGDIPDRDPLERAQAIGYQDDMRWQAKQAKERLDNADRLEGIRLQLEADERTQRMTNGGRSDQEIADNQRQRADAAAEETAELEARLNILNPKRQAAAQRSQTAMAAAALLQRGRAAASNPFMHRMVSELAARDELRRSRPGQQEIARAERDLFRTGRY